LHALSPSSTCLLSPLSSRRGKRRVLLSAVDSLSESLSERERSQAAALPASPPPDTLQHHAHPLTTLPLLLHRIATHRARVHAYTPTLTPLSTPTRYTLRPPPTTPASTTTRPTPILLHVRQPACLAATAITPPIPCIAREHRRRASQSPVTCESPAHASSLRPSHNLALQNGVKSMHAPPFAARRSHWHSAACDCATLAPNKPRHPLTVIHRSSSGNTSSW